MSRSTWTLIVILVLLAGVAFIVLHRPGEQSTTGIGGEKLVRFDSSAVDHMEILSKEGHVVLQKESSAWVMVEPMRSPADQGRVTSALSKAASMEVKSIVSSNPEKQEMFQVDSTGAFVRLAGSGHELAAFHVGKMSPSFMETYVRNEGSNDVALVDGALRYIFVHGTADWRDHTILSVQTDIVRMIGFTYGDTTFTLARSDSAWQIDGQVVRTPVIQSFLSSLSRFTADNFIDSAITETPKINAILSIDGTEVRFCEGVTPGALRVQTSVSPQWFVVQESKTKGLLKRKRDFLE